MFKYYTYVEQILYNYWANIVEQSCKYCTKCFKNIVQNIMQILFKYCDNIVKELSKYYTNALQILWKYFTNILHIFYIYCTNILQTSRRNWTNIAKILYKYFANTVIYYLYIAQLMLKYQPNFEPILCKNKYKNHAKIEQILWKYC